MCLYQSGRAASRRGFNLVEAAIVLGVVGLVIGGIWAASASSRESERITRSTSQVMQIATNLRTLLQNESIGWGSDVYHSQINTGFNNTIFPGDALSNNTPLNPWGLPYIVDIDVLGNASEYVPTIMVRTVMPNVAACSKVANQLYIAFKDEDNLLISIEGDGGYGSASSDPVQAVAACVEANDNLNGEPLMIRASFKL